MAFIFIHGNTLSCHLQISWGHFSVLVNYVINKLLKAFTYMVMNTIEPGVGMTAQ